jgi:hypothetical protein
MFLSLGKTPLANSFLDSPNEFADEMSFPLEVYFCPACSLVQLLDVVSPEVLFRNYIYVTGTSDTIAAHNKGYASTVTGLLNLQPVDLVVEVASNDGSLLKCFGTRTLGVEPALNIAAKAQAAGIDTVTDFFDFSVATKLRAERGPARAVIANNVLAHVDDPRGFLRGAAAMIEGDGMVITEVPYLGDLIRKMEYDTIYHEHLSYFSMTALVKLFANAGLSVVRIDHVPVHGGTVRVYARRQEHTPQHSPEALEMCQREHDSKLTSLECLEAFAKGVQKHKQALLNLLSMLLLEGKTIAGYGAPAKGNTLLNYCEISTSILKYTVDKNPMKVGKLTPGQHVPVFDVSALTERRPDYVLILAWNFADEVMRQQSQFLEQGGRFIVPIPVPSIVGS